MYGSHPYVFLQCLVKLIQTVVINSKKVRTLVIGGTQKGSSQGLQAGDSWDPSNSITGVVGNWAVAAGIRNSR